MSKTDVNNKQALKGRNNLTRGATPGQITKNQEPSPERAEHFSPG